VSVCALIAGALAVGAVSPVIARTSDWLRGAPNRPGGTPLRATAKAVDHASGGLARFTPIVKISPIKGTGAVGSTKQVDIDWCNPVGGTLMTQTVRQATDAASTDVTSQFSVVSRSAPAFCQGPDDFYEAWTGTVTLGPGTNYVTASARDYYNYAADDQATFKTMVPFQRVEVSAAAQSVDVRPGSYHQQLFTVKNTGDGTETFSLTAGTCPSDMTCAAPSPSQLALASGQTGTVTIGYYASATLGVTRTLQLTAADPWTPSISDRSWSEITTTAANPAGAALVGSGDVIERTLCLTASAGADAALECGDLRIVHPLPAVRTMNKPRTPTLFYTSQHAAPFPVISANVTLPAGEALPGTVDATLTVNGVTASQSWNGSDWSAAGETRRISLGTDASAWATGVYPFQLTVRRIISGVPTILQTVSGQLPVVNRISSPFGAGWWLAGLERLYPGGANGDVFWVGGDGSARAYHGVGGNVSLATNVNHPDSLTWDGTYYERHLPNNLRTRFDVNGLHVATINRLGETTSFVYTTAGGRTVLSTITLPVVSGASQYTFQYNGSGQLTGVLSPGASGVRTTTLTVDVASGRINSIQDPDLFQVGFGYDPSVVRRVTSRTDRRNYSTSFSYDAGGRLTSSSLALGGGASITEQFRPIETVGMPGTSRGAAQPLDSAFALIDGARTDVDDLSKFWFTSFGAVARIRDPLGHETKLTYGSALWPALPTEVRDATQFITQAGYNARGLVDWMTAVNPVGTGNATTNYLWHARWNFPTSVTTATGTTTTYTYDAATGNRLTQQLGSSGVVNFGYDGLGRLSSVTVPGTLPETYEYDPVLGNLSAQVSSSGARRSSYANAIGSDTLVNFPVAAAVTGWQRTTYDVMGQATRIANFGPAISVDAGSKSFTAPADSVAVTHQYDAEGHVTETRRSRGVYFSGTGYPPIPTTYLYDGAGRKTTEIQGGTGMVNFAYDPAGNVTSRSKLSNVVTFVYDAANRSVRRIVPQVSYAPRDCHTFYESPYCSFTLPTNPAGVCIAADTANFAYDPAGRVIRADNIYARIRRGYTASGLVSADSTLIRSYYSTGWSPCETNPSGGTPAEFDGQTPAVVRPSYDLDGRRTSLVHPGGTQGYGYANAQNTGLLSSVTDVNGGSYSIVYDPALRVSEVHYPGGVTETRTYGTDGRMSSRSIPGLADDAFTYDPQDRIVNAVTQYRGGASYGGPAAHTWYSGLGAVVAADGYGNAGASTEFFDVDALGNRLRREQHGLRPPGHADELGIRRSSYDSDARLESVADTAPPGVDPYLYTAAYEYNQGNLSLAHSHESDSYAGTNWFDQTMSFYDAFDKLRALERHADDRPGTRSVFEEYRMDAFGRRVLVRAKHGTGCPSALVECASYLESVVWDGDQVLREVRSDDPQVPRNQSFAYGQVTYTHALGIDQPISVIKDGVAVMPHADWMGRYEVGTLASGATTLPCNGAASCPIISWPGGQSSLDGAPLHAPTTQSWWGNVISGNADASGYQYRRNRYYDPETGRFTQADPIGLGGGLNLYGFAGGDPVNYADPFGLKDCAKDQTQVGDFCYDPVAMVGAAMGAVMGTLQTGARLLGSGLRALSSAGNTARWGDEVFAIAKAGGRNSGFLQNYAGRSATELSKAERSLSSRIAEHKGFLANPAEHVENWASLRPGHQQSLINHWKSEIRTANEQIQILRRIP
jgi:RHS repeat-associated protein